LWMLLPTSPKADFTRSSQLPAMPFSLVRNGLHHSTGPETGLGGLSPASLGKVPATKGHEAREITPRSRNRFPASSTRRLFVNIDAQDHFLEVDRPLFLGMRESITDHCPRSFSCSSFPSWLSCPSCASMFFGFLSTWMNRIYRILVPSRLAPKSDLKRIMRLCWTSFAAASRPVNPVHPVHRCSINGPSRLSCTVAGARCALRPIPGQLRVQQLLFLFFLLHPVNPCFFD